MTGCLIKLREMLDSLPVTERKIALVLLDSPDRVVNMQIDELAAASGVSAASVVRLSKRMGYSGYKDLCRGISVELALQRADIPYEDIYPDSDLETIVRTTCYTDIQAIENTLSMIDYDQFGKAVDALAAAPRVDFYGIGSSGIVSRDGSLKFLRLNKSSVTEADPHYQCIAASTLKPGDVAVLISYSGTTFDTIDTLKVAKESGATTISITKYGSTPLSDLADIKLWVDNSESILRSGAMGSRIGHLAIIDMLFAAVSSRLFNELRNHLDETQLMLNRKRLHIK